MNIQFVKSEKGEGSRFIGTLTWGTDTFSVITGGYGKGALPDGSYDIEIRKVVVGTKETMQSGFINSKTGRGWFIPLTPKFSTSRHGFGIHPDGNKPGTKGCVGLQGDDIKAFYDKWITTPMKSRPSTLLVTSEVDKN
jgi:hypothetical protein